jgi:hypothetical protein
MPDPLTVLVIDDERARATDWAQAISESGGQLVAKSQALEDAQFREAIELLRERQRASRSEKAVPSEASELDEVDMLVVDYDLLLFDDSGIETGESVAYLARCYSRCGIIVTLNQFGDNTFDLNLSPRYGSFAELNIGSTQLMNAGLWRAPFVGYRPWQWPLLVEAVSRLRRRIDVVEQNLDGRVLDVLGFTPSAKAGLHRSVAELLAGGGVTSDVSEVTFRDFAISTGQGLRLRDRTMNEEGLARIAASRVARWLEDAVLPGQDVLVDAPHLIRRFPSLLKGDANVLDDLDGTAVLEVRANELPIEQSAIDRWCFTATDWLSRPAWFWPDVSGEESIEEVARPWASRELSAEFCEDVSRFVPREGCRQFVSGLETPFRRRYVVDPNSEWGKQAISDVSPDSAADFTAVRYHPSMSLAIEH